MSPGCHSYSCHSFFSSKPIEKNTFPPSSVSFFHHSFCGYCWHLCNVDTTRFGFIFQWRRQVGEGNRKRSLHIRVRVDRVWETARAVPCRLCVCCLCVCCPDKKARDNWPTVTLIFPAPHLSSLSLCESRSLCTELYDHPTQLPCPHYKSINTTTYTLLFIEL